ncbi:MAG: YlxR family protein [Clostridia bacterium]|nr:YlxR family protein [Clostridia bacterium]
MCVGCREMKPKAELIRVVKPPEGEAFLDPTGKKPGRGAYICRDVECLKKAKKQKSLSRALDAAMSEEIYAQLERRLEELKC